MFADHDAICQKIFYPRFSPEKATLTVEVEGATLGCFVVNRHPGAETLLYFHGNGEVAAEYVEGGYADIFLKMGVNVCFAEYRGYGQSTGRPQLGAMLGDGEKIVQALGLPPEKVVAFGRSLGSIYAIELANRLPNLGGVIIESGIGDVSQALKRLVGDLGSLGISPQQLADEIDAHFNHQKKLEKYPGPLLILHAEGDMLLRKSNAESLFGWSHSLRKKLVVLPQGDHNSIFYSNMQQYLKEVKEFLDGTGIVK